MLTLDSVKEVQIDQEQPFLCQSWLQRHSFQELANQLICNWEADNNRTTIEIVMRGTIQKVQGTKKKKKTWPQKNSCTNTHTNTCAHQEVFARTTTHFPGRFSQSLMIIGATPHSLIAPNHSSDCHTSATCVILVKQCFSGFIWNTVGDFQQERRKFLFWFIFLISFCAHLLLVVLERKTVSWIGARCVGMSSSCGNPVFRPRNPKTLLPCSFAGPSVQESREKGTNYRLEEQTNECILIAFLRCPFDTEHDKYIVDTDQSVVRESFVVRQSIQLQCKDGTAGKSLVDQHIRDCWGKLNIVRQVNIFFQHIL